MSLVSKRFFLRAATALLAGAALGLQLTAVAAEAPKRVTVDYAYYNPVALLLKKRGWLEEAFAKDGIEVRWVLSLGSNKALEFLNGGSVDFGSTAGAASVIARAQGVPIKAVYIYSRPEWTALVTRKETGIARLEDLKGKTVAVTRGTDPHIFLLRALASVGLSEKEIKPVLLQHPDGQRALVAGQVDAWAGLDPHMAKAQLEDGSVLFYRNTDFNTYGVLNVREAFAKEHPELVTRVLEVYERARLHAQKNPAELKAALVEAAKIPDAVAELQLSERTDISKPVIGPQHREAWLAAGTLLREIGVIKPEVDVAATVDGLIEAGFAQRVVAQR